ncbi:MAG: hypothetical protein ACRDE2_15015 [Chitinophagaceae bacterium]
MPTSFLNSQDGRESIEKELEQLFEKSSVIEQWMKAHWNQDNTDAYREQRRRYMALMDEINIILDTI